MRDKILFIAFCAIGALLLTTLNSSAQSPSSTPAASGSDDPVMMGGYKVKSSIELGVRGLSVEGSNEKYRSDFNYRPGFRIFDSSFVLETEDGKGKPFDSLMITSSGWSADPTGYVRVNMEKMGAYRFDANIRQVRLINQVSNFVLGYNRADTRRNFGDFDLTVFPQSEKLRLRFGASFNNQTGDLGFTVRTRDVFPIVQKIKSNTIDFRAGLDTKLAGFNFSFTGGVRSFDDRSKYVIDSRNVGFAGTFVAADVNFINKLERANPLTGYSKYGSFSMQRTFAKKLDLTGRFVYSITDRSFSIFENFSGEGPISRTNPTLIFIDADIFEIFGRIKRPQARGDLGVTYAVTDKFRISNTFTFDQFNSSGDSTYSEKVISRLQSNGTARPDTFSSTFYWRLNGLKRFTNTIEGDYQVNSRFGFNLGYRFTHRVAVVDILNRPLPTGTVTARDEEEENSTHTFLFGAKIKPVKNWVIYADAERGEADNAFTRLANYDFTNFRVRSNWNYKRLNFNVSGIIRNNENPSFSSAVGTTVPAGDLFANVRSRIFSAYVDYVPDPKWTLSGGYTYHYLTSKTDIVLQVSSLTRGFSEYHVRDNYVFFDVSARPVNRISIYGTYRYNRDKGQGDRISTVQQNIIASYPFTLHTPEIRIAVKLTKNIDWNVGYQYNNYKENLRVGYFSLDDFAATAPAIPFPGTNFLPNQNYRAHLPYTSLRIYFGGVDR